LAPESGPQTLLTTGAGRLCRTSARGVGLVSHVNVRPTPPDVDEVTARVRRLAADAHAQLRLAETTLHQGEAPDAIFVGSLLVARLLGHLEALSVLTPELAASLLSEVEPLLNTIDVMVLSAPSRSILSTISKPIA
jgi:hypothetical protein